MFEELPFIFGFMTFSIIISYILIKYTSGPFLTIVKVLAIFGIIIHELCHLVMCIITHAPIENITLISKIESEKSEKIRYYGRVDVREHKISFLQAFLISFAPLYISFWFFFFLLDLLLHTQVSPLVFFLCLFIMMSLVFSAGPSFTDLKIVPIAFQNDTYHSLYQILLIFFSFLTTWIMIFVFGFQFNHEIFFYLVIVGFYFIFKYGFKLTGYIFHSINQKWIKDYRRPKKTRVRRFSRPKYKPKKPRRERW